MYAARRMKPYVQIFDSSGALAVGAADRIADLLDGPGRRSLGLAGGSTPVATYEQLSARSFDWSKVDLWLGDERWVPHDSADSNTRMAREALADRVDARFHPIPYDRELGPAAGAQMYESTLTEAFRASGNRPTVVLLGLGDDGHTASLFPDTTAVGESERLYRENWVPKLEAWRLTATRPLLSVAEHILFLVGGRAKAEAVRWLVAPRDTDPSTPARMVALGGNDVTVLLDESAAADL